MRRHFSEPTHRRFSNFARLRQQTVATAAPEDRSSPGTGPTPLGGNAPDCGSTSQENGLLPPGMCRAWRSTGNWSEGIARRKLISIVDDDEWARQGTSVYVESCGYDCATFCTAEEYLSFDGLRDTDCLVADVHLPGINGPDLQDRLIADGYRIPVIFVSGFFDEEIRNRVLRTGALCYLTKPYSEKTLSAYLERALRNVSFDLGGGLCARSDLHED